MSNAVNVRQSMGNVALIWPILNNSGTMGSNLNSAAIVGPSLSNAVTIGSCLSNTTTLGSSLSNAANVGSSLSISTYATGEQIIPVVPQYLKNYLSYQTHIYTDKILYAYLTLDVKAQKF